MHITEGIVTGVPAVASWAVASTLVGVGAWRMKEFIREHPAQKPLLGMAGAFIFFLSFIPLPAFTGTCSHPCGSPLAGILLGPWIGIALTGLSLMLQALFFAHGGISTWGVNVLSLGVGGALGGWLVFRIARRCGASLWVAGALGGLLGDVITYLISGLILGGTLAHGPTPQFSFSGYLSVIYLAYLPVQGPIALGEMYLTGLILHYIYQQRPEVLESLRVVAIRRKVVAAAAVMTLLLLLCCAAPAYTTPTTPPVAQSVPRGMDEAVNERLAIDAGRPPHAPYINTEKLGDLWNTLLLLAGGTCGFLMGRWWHLMFEKPQTVAREGECPPISNQEPETRN